MTSRIPLGRKFRLFTVSLLIAFAVASLKLLVHQLSVQGIVDLEVIELSEIVKRSLPGIIGGGIFVIGVVLAATLSDYKEAERMPAELISALMAIYEDGKRLAERHDFQESEDASERFDLDQLKTNLLEVIRRLRQDLGEGKPDRILDSIDQISESILQMEASGLPANHAVKLKNEQTSLRRNALRMCHIQRTVFVPSATVLLFSVVTVTLVMMVFTRTETYFESSTMVGVLTFILVHLALLVKMLEHPFHPEKSQYLDDVDFYLLRVFVERLGGQWEAVIASNGDAE